jgi:hypothetical protein
VRKPLTVPLTILTLALAGVVPAAAAGSVKGPTVKRPAYGLTGGSSLVKFDASNTSRARNLGAITGLAAGEKIVAVDFRPSIGILYGLGDRSNLYEIAMGSAAATRRSSLKTPDGAPVALRGSRFAIDFNPTNDLLRVIGDTGQNLRVNVDSGVATAEQAVAYGGAVSGSARPRIVGAAYSNNDNDSFVDPPLVPFDRPTPTGTKLYTIDATRNALASQDPSAGSSSLRAVGSLRRSAGPAVGFDIYSAPNSEGNTAFNIAYASLLRGGRARLYKVDLGSAKAKRVTGRPLRGVVDIAVKP